MGFAQEQVETLSRALDEPSWLTERRLEAWGYYEKLELPREKDEPWRYTDLRRLGFDLGDFAPTEPNPYDAGLALGPNRTAYLGTVSGMVALKDG